MGPRVDPLIFVGHSANEKIMNCGAILSDCTVSARSVPFSSSPSLMWYYILFEDFNGDIDV